MNATSEAYEELDAVRLDPVERALDDIRAGRAVVVVDDPGRENEGDLIFAASKATPQLMGLMVRYSSGYVCAPVTGEILDRLGIALMTPHNRDRLKTAYTVSVDARDGVTTGISAADRARTVRVLADSATEPFELVQPGHILPLRAKPGGVLARAGHTEAAVDLTRLAGLTPAGVIGELINDDGSLMRAPRAARVRRRARSGDDLDRGPQSRTGVVTRRRSRGWSTTRLPTEFGTFLAYGYRNVVDGNEHVALVLGDLGDEFRRPRPCALRVPDR